MDAANLDLPQFLDPLLKYLSTALPPTVYDVLVFVLAHSLSFIASLYSLLKALASSHPSAWDVQVILPPLITLLAAYLALVGFYRTTSWMIRSTLWLVKWGTILSVLAAGAGWMMGNAYANGENGVGGPFTGAGILPTIGGLLLDMMNGRGQNAAGGSRQTTGSRSTRSRSQGQQAPRPHAEESWDRHQEWQYREYAQDRGHGGGTDGGLQQIMGNLFSAASESGWWEAAKGVADEFTKGVQGQDREEASQAGTGRRKQPERKTKSKANPNTRNGRS